MKPIILVLNIFTKGYNGITLYPFIILKEKNVYVLAHELVHFEQVQRIGFFKFYGSYVAEYFKNVFKFKSLDVAYRNISYEADAYTNESQNKYLEKAYELLKEIN